MWQKTPLVIVILAHANSVSDPMKILYKFIFSSALFFAPAIFADEYVWGEPFKEGDTVSAETFNQIFDTIQKLNRTVTDADLEGSWSCDAMTTRDTQDWTNSGSFYLLEGAQINFLGSSAGATSFDNPFEVTTSSPSPLKKTSTSFFGTYQLYRNMLFVKETSDSNARIYAVDLVSPTRIELTFLETSATSFPASYSSFISCESTAVIPSPPSSPTISQDGFSVTVDWADNSQDEEGFRVYRRSSSETTALEIATTTTNSYYDTDVVDQETYFYSVAAFTTDGESSRSNIVNATIDSVPPTVVSTSPLTGQTIARDDRTFTITFSELIDVFCPEDPSLINDLVATCPSGSNAIKGSVLVSGNLRQLFGGSFGSRNRLTLGASAIGSAELYDANQTVTVTIDSSYIRDVNGVQMEGDYVFQFEIGDYVNNPNCPPSC